MLGFDKVGSIAPGLRYRNRDFYVVIEASRLCADTVVIDDLTSIFDIEACEAYVNMSSDT